ncbi:MAG: PilZ domain-containing protein [Proteobacteria bacterium]|nr:PilZ domain-containing protein [Pseudomonadota bacterium]
MTIDSSQTERRKHERYQVPNLVVALPKKSSAQIARIINISEGGMAVRYLDQNDWLGPANKIDVLANSNFFMTNIPISSVRDFKVENDISFSIISERQCCLKFGELTPEQHKQLDEFILNYTAGQA